MQSNAKGPTSAAGTGAASGGSPVPTPAQAAYLKTQVLTATPERLRMMLLDGAVRYATMARDGLASKDFSKSFEGFSKAREIVLELMNSMKPEAAPEMCARLSSLYTFMYTELVSASLEKDAGKVERVIELLEYERETWGLVMEKLAEEKAAGVGAGAERRGVVCVEG